MVAMTPNPASVAPTVPVRPLTPVEQLDSIDKAILVEIRRMPKATNTDIGKRLGMTRQTIATRRNKPLFRRAESEATLSIIQQWQRDKDRIYRKIIQVALADMNASEGDKDRGVQMLKALVKALGLEPPTQIELGPMGLGEWLAERMGKTARGEDE